MSKDIIEYGMDKKLAVTTDQVDLIKRTVAVGATDDELKLFIYDCQRRGVHPLDRMIFFVKRMVTEGEAKVGKAVHQTSIDFLRSQADTTKSYAGMDEIEYVDAPQGDYPIKATATVYKMVDGARVPFSATARWVEFYPGERQGFMWKKMPYHMLGKCAEAQALRKAFPQQLHGLYVEEELQRETIDVTPEKKPSETVREKVTAGEGKKTAEKKETAPPPPPGPDTNENVREALKMELSRYCDGNRKEAEALLAKLSYYKKGTKEYTLTKFEDIDDPKTFDWRIENVLKAFRELPPKGNRAGNHLHNTPPEIEGCTKDPKGCDHSTFVDDKVLCGANKNLACFYLTEKTLL